MPGISLVLALSLVNQTAVQAARVVLPLFLLDLDAGPATIGMVAAAFSVFPAVLAVPLGRLIDRRGSRLPLIVSAVAGLAGMLVPFFVRGIPAIFIAAIMISLAMACLNLTSQNLVGVLSTPENRPHNFSNFALANSTASFLGPVLAGLCIDHFGYAAACGIVAAMFAPLLPILVLSRHAALDKVVPREGQKKGVLRDLLKGRGIKAMLFASSMQAIADTLFSYYMPVYCHSIGLSASAIGLILGMHAAASFVVRLGMPKMIKRLGEYRMLSFAFYLGGTSALLIPFFSDAYLLGLLAFTLGLGMGLTGPTVSMLMFANSPPGRSAEALGLRVIANHSTKIVSPIILGYVVAATSLGPAFWLTASFLIGGAWLSQQLVVGKVDEARSSEKT